MHVDLNRIREGLKKKGYKHFFIGVVSIKKSEADKEGSHMVVTLENDREPDTPPKFQHIVLMDKDYNFVREVS